MAEVVIKPRIRGFICTTAHPAGCTKNVEEQIAIAQKARTSAPERYRVLVIGGG